MQKEKPISFLRGEKVDPTTDYRSILPKNATGILRPVLGAQGYMLQMPGLTQYGSATGLSVAVSAEDLAGTGAYPDDVTVGYRVGSNGIAYDSLDGVTYDPITGEWLVSGSASVCQVRLTPTSGTFDGAAVDTWLDCTTTRTWTVTASPGDGGASAVGLLEFRDTISLRVIASAVITAYAESFNNWVAPGTACMTLSGDNLIADSNSTNCRARGAFGKTAGKWYWEVAVNTVFNNGAASVATTWAAGIGLSSFVDGTSLGTTATEFAAIVSRSATTPNTKQQILKRNNNSSTALSPSYSYTSNPFTPPDILGIALDLDVGAIWFSHMGSWLNGATIGEIEAGTTTHAFFTGITGQTFYPAISIPDTGYVDNLTLTANFGATAYTYTKPTGFSTFI